MVHGVRSATIMQAVRGTHQCMGRTIWSPCSYGLTYTNDTASWVLNVLGIRSI